MHNDDPRLEPRLPTEGALLASHLHNDDPLLKPGEAAEYLRTTPAHLAQLRHRGIGPRFLRLSPRLVVYKLSALNAFIEAAERTSTREGAA